MGIQKNALGKQKENRTESRTKNVKKSSRINVVGVMAPAMAMAVVSFGIGLEPLQEKPIGSE